MSAHVRDTALKVTILGGDLRYIYLANQLTKLSYSVSVYGNDIALYTLPKCEISLFTNHINTLHSTDSIFQNNDIIIGPIPFSKDGKNITMHSSFPKMSVTYLFEKLESSIKLFGGAIKPEFKEYLTSHKIEFYDFMALESVAVSNAIATAEGAIVEAIKRSTINLHKSNVLVLGYGRCAKILASKLKGLDAFVTVGARKPDVLAYANAYGFQTLPLCDNPLNLEPYDFVFNTIPSLVITREALENANSNIVIIDIASAPGGVDFDAARELNINASLCLALPGFYAPKASAKILTDVISNI